MLTEVIKDSHQWAEVCRKFGVKPCTGSQGHVKKRAVAMGIDFSHFKGNGWNRGMSTGPKRPIEDYLSNKFRVRSDSLKKRLFKEGIKEKKCESCGIIEWLGKQAPLEMHHINGDCFDNSLKNIMILCPNCHSQTLTYRGKNVKLRAIGAIG